jgi:hypothetical protein
VRGDNLWLFALDGTLDQVEPGFTGERAAAASPR